MVKVIRQVSHGEEMRVPDPRPQAIPTTPDLRALWGGVWEVAFSDLGWGRHEAGEPKKKAGWLGKETESASTGPRPHTVWLFYHWQGACGYFGKLCTQPATSLPG